MRKNLILSVLMLSVILMVVGSVSAVTHELPFGDDFEGTYGELVDDWIVYDLGSDPNDDVYLSENYPIDGQYVVIKDDASIVASISTEGYENIQLNYDRRTFAGYGDILEVRWRVGDSGSWNFVEDVSFSNWQHNTFSLGPDADNQPEIQISFKLNNGNNDRGLVDNVLVTGENEDPNVTICIGCCPDGIEADTASPSTETTIEIDASDNSNIVSCEIDWDDGTPLQSCMSDYTDAEYTHQYGDGGYTINPYTITVTVEDGLGNDESASTEANVENVAPWNVDINGSNEVAAGQTATFTTNAEDVQIDEDAGLTYTWTFDGSDDVVTSIPTVDYIWTSASEHTIDLCVEDKDGDETCATQKVIEVIQPIELADQEVAAFYPLQADFEDESTPQDYQFHHGLTGVGPSFPTCSIVQGPDNLGIGSNGGWACGIQWNRDTVGPISGIANPTNAERGTNHVIIKVNNGTDIEYYSFDIEVYSWIISLDEEWNLISIPLTAEDSNPWDMLSVDNARDKIEQIWSYEYDVETGDSEWYCVKPTSSSGQQCGGVTKLTTIEPGKAYWVKLKDVEDPTAVKSNGFSPDDVQGGPMLPPSVDVPTNAWSLIGRYGIVSSGSGTSRVYGSLPEGTALDSLDKVDNDLHVYTEDFSITSSLANNEGYWLWIEDNAYNNAEFESYAPIDSWYPKNSGLSI